MQCKREDGEIIICSALWQYRRVVKLVNLQIVNDCLKSWSGSHVVVEQNRISSHRLKKFMCRLCDERGGFGAAVAVSKGGESKMSSSSRNVGDSFLWRLYRLSKTRPSSPNPMRRLCDEVGSACASRGTEPRPFLPRPCFK